MKKKSSNWFEGKYVAMKGGGYLDITEAMHDSCDGKFCFQVTAEIFRNCSRNEDGTIYLIDDADDKTVKKIASARSSLNPKKVRAELHRLKSEGIFMFEPYSPKSYWKHGVYRLVKSFPWRETLSFEEQIQEGMIFDSVAIQYIFFVNVQLANGELIPFPVSKLGKHTDTLSRKEEAEKLAREAVQEVKNVLLPRLEKGIEIQSIYLERKCGV